MTFANYGYYALLLILIICTCELVGLFPTFSVFVAKDTTYIPTPAYTELVGKHLSRKEASRK